MTADQQPSHADPPPRYGSLYAAFGVVALALSASNLYLTFDAEGRLERQSLWDLVHTSGGAEIGFLSLLLIFILVGMCGYAAVRPVRSVAFPLVVAGLALPGALMLMFKVGFTGEPPPFDDGGGMLVSTIWGAIALALVHALHLAIWRRHNR